MKLPILFLSVLGCIFKGQVAIGTSSVSDGVALQLESAEKGVLIPRVALTSRVSSSPLPATLLTGTIVFNTATAGTFPNSVKPGLYWWSTEDQQWTNFDYDLNAASLKYTNSESTTNYNTTTLQALRLFGNKIVNESGSVYEVNTANQTVTIKRAGLYSVSAILAFDRQSGGNASRLSLTAGVYVNNNPVGTLQVINPDYTLSITADRGLFSHGFTEVLQLSKNDVLSVRIVRTTGTYGSGYGTAGVNFKQSGDSSISITRIR